MVNLSFKLTRKRRVAEYGGNLNRLVSLKTGSV